VGLACSPCSDARARLDSDSAFFCQKDEVSFSDDVSSLAAPSFADSQASPARASPSRDSSESAVPCVCVCERERERERE
jgi:hypothetical protein